MDFTVTCNQRQRPCEVWCIPAGPEYAMMYKGPAPVWGKNGDYRMEDRPLHTWCAWEGNRQHRCVSLSMKEKCRYFLWMIPMSPSSLSYVTAIQFAKVVTETQSTHVWTFMYCKPLQYALHVSHSNHTSVFNQQDFFFLTLEHVSFDSFKCWGTRLNRRWRKKDTSHHLLYTCMVLYFNTRQTTKVFQL